MGLMVPVLAGYIAYSIADRPGLAVGFTGGLLASSGNALVTGYNWADSTTGFQKFIADFAFQGANGVIIITTKRGKAGKTRVNFNAYLSFNSPTSMVKGMYGTREVRRFVDRANYQADLASGNWGSSNLTADDLNIWMTLEDGTSQLDIIHDGSYTDWYDTFMQNSTTQNYEASVSGGNEKTTFSASAAAMYDKGLLKQSRVGSSGHVIG